MRFWLNQSPIRGTAGRKTCAAPCGTIGIENFDGNSAHFLPCTKLLDMLNSLHALQAFNVFVQHHVKGDQGHPTKAELEYEPFWSCLGY
jgi:hypothetical protein